MEDIKKLSNEHLIKRYKYLHENFPVLQVRGETKKLAEEIKRRGLNKLLAQSYEKKD